MKTAEPKIIYLQIGDDADITEFEESDFQTNAITWCWEKIFKNDIEYISKQSIIGLIDSETEKLNNALYCEMERMGELVVIGELASRVEILLELKQKIEEIETI